MQTIKNIYYKKTNTNNKNQIQMQKINTCANIQTKQQFGTKHL